MSQIKVEGEQSQSPSKAIMRKKWDKVNRTDEQVSLSQLNISETDDKENQTKESVRLPSVYLKNENKDASIMHSAIDGIFNDEISQKQQNVLAPSILHNLEENEAEEEQNFQERESIKPKTPPVVRERISQEEIKDRQDHQITSAVAAQAFQMDTIKELDNESTAQKSILNKSKKRDRNAFMRQLPLGPSQESGKSEQIEAEPKYKRNYEENFEIERNKEIQIELYDSQQIATWLHNVTHLPSLKELDQRMKKANVKSDDRELLKSIYTRKEFQLKQTKWLDFYKKNKGRQQKIKALPKREATRFNPFKLSASPYQSVFGSTMNMQRSMTVAPKNMQKELKAMDTTKTRKGMRRSSSLGAIINSYQSNKNNLQERQHQRSQSVAKARLVSLVPSVKSTKLATIPKSPNLATKYRSYQRQIIYENDEEI